MKIEFTFDRVAVEQKGYTLSSVYDTLKREFDKRNLICVSDSDVLAFEASGGKNDYSNMLVMIMGLTRADWFMSIVSSCIWCEGEGKREDILSQAKERAWKRA